MAAEERLYMSSASAPGKLILFGEHAVVYGKTAIAGALSDLRVHIEASIVRSGSITVTFPPVKDSCVALSVPLATVVNALAAEFSCVEGGLKPHRPEPGMVAVLKYALVGTSDNAQLQKAALSPLYLACSMFKEPLTTGACPGIDIAITASTLPVAAGLGSSAALSVATAAALLDCWCQLCGGYGPAGIFGMKGPASTLAIVNEWAYASECLFHGSPSGLDNTVSSMGGALTYARTPGDTSIRVAPILGLPPLRLLIVNTKVPKETSKLVAGVRVLHDAHPLVIGCILDAIQAISDEVSALSTARVTRASAGSGSGENASTLIGAEFEALSRLVRVNHSLLNGLGVGHPALDAVVCASWKRGWACKLTGAGGGGCALVLLPPQLHREGEGSEQTAAQEEAIAGLQAELRASGCDVFATALGGRGLEVEKRPGIDVELSF